MLLLFIFTQFLWAQNAESIAKNKTSNKEVAKFSNQAIKAYQESAVYKIKDYYAFLELYANQKTSDSLKIEIKASIFDLFINKNVKVFDFVTLENKPIPLEKLLVKIENKNYKFEILDVESSILASDFWTTKYNLEVIEENQNCHVEVFSTVIFKPVIKQFGSRAKEVWTLFLSDMK